MNMNIPTTGGGGNPNQKLMVGAVAAAVALYGAYSYGQKNPKSNSLDVPP